VISGYSLAISGQSSRETGPRTRPRVRTVSGPGRRGQDYHRRSLLAPRPCLSPCTRLWSGMSGRAARHDSSSCRLQGVLLIADESLLPHGFSRAGAKSSMLRMAGLHPEGTFPLSKAASQTKLTNSILLDPGSTEFLEDQRPSYFGEPPKRRGRSRAGRSSERGA
jgi:hypothetical protein